MNPEGKFYKGRSQLPENLKSMFRQIVMDQPQAIKIIETLLYSIGVGDVERYSHQFYQVFQDLESVFGNKGIFEWGLRMIKLVIQSMKHNMESHEVQKSFEMAI